MTSRAHALIERSKHHGKHSAEGTMKSSHRIRKGIGMLFDRGGDPRVSKLQQQRTTGSKEDCALPIDLPGKRPGAEHPQNPPASGLTPRVNLKSKALRTDN